MVWNPAKLNRELTWIFLDWLSRDGETRRQGGRGDKAMGQLGDGAMERWEDGETWGLGDGETRRWGFGTKD
jgi:hypothetical protein